MGGGKTHSMIALALLAKDKKSRYEQLGDMYDDIENIKVIAFSGRESDAKYEIPSVFQPTCPPCLSFCSPKYL